MFSDVTGVCECNSDALVVEAKISEYTKKVFECTEDSNSERVQKHRNWEV
jgi:hypothetical protein